MLQYIKLSTDDIQAEFKYPNVTKFGSLYQRNNKGKTQKNLRCYPHCGSRHNVFGYCGTKILVDIHLPAALTGIQAFAEFHPYVNAKTTKNTSTSIGFHYQIALKDVGNKVASR